VSAGAGTVDLVLRVAREGLLLAVLVSAPPLLASALVGFVVGVFQSATRIHDQALGFVPKVAVVTLCLLAMGPVLGAQVVRFSRALFLLIPSLG
jgi:type III secretory pathway component EscS